MAGQFDADPEAITAFADNVDAIAAQLEVSKSTLGGVSFQITVWGVVGSLFAMAAAAEVGKAAGCIAKYEEGLREAAKNARLTADTYTNVDQGNADTFSRGA
ncbi:type VII secretion target [Lentzea sp. NPDC059081]|uniref:type VII secretion target n=1 Tax=Lentzea sp. NPDC059081 TaxID=3346719 RepID=UPI0036CA2EB4